MNKFSFPRIFFISNYAVEDNKPLLNSCQRAITTKAISVSLFYSCRTSVLRSLLQLYCSEINFQHKNFYYRTKKQEFYCSQSPPSLSIAILCAMPFKLTNKKKQPAEK